MPYQENVMPQPIPAQPAASEEPAPVNNPVNTTPQPSRVRLFFWQGKVFPAFWTIASLVSLVVNVILVIILISLGQQLFSLKSVVEGQVLGGLYTNFQMMDSAHIRTTIPVSAEVPAKFDLPLSTNTVVVLTEDTVITGATVHGLTAFGGNLHIPTAVTNITLPAGTNLPVALNLTVPVDQKIPVNLMVNVDIPLNQTDLHQPFVGLQEVVKPYYTLLNSLPNSWVDTLCNPDDKLCEELVR